VLVNTDVSQECYASIMRVRELDLSFDTEVIRERIWFHCRGIFQGSWSCRTTWRGRWQNI